MLLLNCLIPLLHDGIMSTNLIFILTLKYCHRWVQSYLIKCYLVHYHLVHFHLVQVYQFIQLPVGPYHLLVHCQVANWPDGQFGSVTN